MGIYSVVFEWGRERGNHRRLGTFVLSFFLSTLSGADNAFSTVTSILATQSVVPAAGINIWDLVRNAECQTPPKSQWIGIFISVLEKQSSRKSYLNLFLWCYESQPVKKGRDITVVTSHFIRDLPVNSMWIMQVRDREGTVKTWPHLGLCNSLQKGLLGFSTCSSLKRLAIAHQETR